MDTTEQGNVITCDNRKRQETLKNQGFETVSQNNLETLQKKT